MADPLPLTTLLSQALVAFTIELDNEFEHRMEHRTTTRDAPPGPSDAPWLTSLAMWASCVEHLDQDGATVAELERRARTHTNLDGMRRWGYITIDGRGRGPGAARVHPGSLLRLTPAGLGAQATWRPLPALVEERWRERFGPVSVERLRAALATIVAGLEPGLPDCLPILGHGLFCERAEPTGTVDVGSELPLSALLSRPLLVLAGAYERKRDLSLAISANLLRVLDERGVRRRDLPMSTGVSKAAIDMSLGVLERQELAVVEPDPAGSRFRHVRLTPLGRARQVAHTSRLARVEAGVVSRAPIATEALRGALEQVVGEHARLLRGLEPYPEGWRASAPTPSALPHVPMVLHRGGFPDGS